ncbi:hypothetical protein LRF89_08965 [Halorhodospira sp. 9621]|uniref:hypothetical protein n=1 Tax=Halorhodospira sp. 9621 TaxID=2899135 RepID=UPI001EE8EC1D|nr:hypothetical protein [Halorhodospira sp. 9621]MCG5533568.1 hypothetical protein [Halorhodospira sp. 9621]
MKAFAAFILRGPFQAATVMVAAALLPLLSVLAAGALALVTLRDGLRQGVVVGAMAGAALFALMFAALGTGEPALRLILEQWVPVLLLAEVLRRSVSLPLTLLLWMGLGAVAVIGFHLVVPDPAAYWRSVVEAFLAVAGGEAELGGEAGVLLQDELLPVMTGLWAVNLMLVVLAGLLIGRGLQALLFNPGGLRAEFHALDLGREAALVALVLWLGGLFAGPSLITDLALVTGAAFVVQAIAFSHAIVAARGLSGGWLVPVYVLAPLLFRPLALVGIGDALFQWRRRLGGGTSSQ